MMWYVLGTLNTEDKHHVLFSHLKSGNVLSAYTEFTPKSLHSELHLPFTVLEAHVLVHNIVLF